MATPARYLSQRSRRQVHAGLPECPSSEQRWGKSRLGVPLPRSSNSTIMPQHWWCLSPRLRAGEEGSRVTAGHHGTSRAPGGEGRDGGRPLTGTALLSPGSVWKKSRWGNGGAKPQNLGSGLPLPTEEGGSRRIWQLPGSERAALRLRGLQKATGQPLGLVETKPPCLR